MATVADLLETLDRIAPFALAEEWDNVGLIAGSEGWDVRGPVVLTIDLTHEVAREAVAMGAGAVVAYHPPIFSAIKRVTGSAILELLGARIAIVSPHTALDAALDGLADFLADIVATSDGRSSGGTDRVALTPHSAHRCGNTHKVVTFVPRAAADVVRDAMSAAGAGVIGAYDSCAFGAQGTGSFRGSPQSNPTVGHRGRLEQADEVRLEMVCPGARVADVIVALRGAHTYEEAPIDIYPLAPVPDRRIGAGRAVTLEKPIGIAELSSRVKKALGVGAAQIAAASDTQVTRVGVCPGAGDSLIDAAADVGCDAFLTGEMRHHDVLAAVDRGVCVILAGHTETERPYLPRLAARLQSASPSFQCVVSTVDRSPFA